MQPKFMVINLPSYPTHAIDPVTLHIWTVICWWKFRLPIDIRRLADVQNHIHIVHFTIELLSYRQQDSGRNDSILSLAFLQFCPLLSFVRIKGLEEECGFDKLLASNGTEQTTLRAAAARKKAQMLLKALAISGITSALSDSDSAWKALPLDPDMKFPISASETSGRTLPTLSTAILLNKLPLIARKRTIPRSWAVCCEVR